MNLICPLPCPAVGVRPVIQLAWVAAVQAHSGNALIARLTGPPVAARGSAGAEDVTAHLSTVGSSDVVDDALHATVRAIPNDAIDPHTQTGTERRRRFV